MKLFNFGKRVKKESEVPLKERPSAYQATDYISPNFESISYSDIQALYDRSNLLKKYIKILIDEIKRYEITVTVKKSEKLSKQAYERVKQLKELLNKSNPTESFEDIREKYWKDLFLYGRGGIELEPSEGSTIKDMYAVPGYCIRLNTDDKGNLKEKEAYQLVDPDETDKVVAKFNINSFVYFVLDKLSDRIYGSAPITSIYQELITDINTSNNLGTGVTTIKAGLLSIPNSPKTLLKDIISRLTLLIKKNSRVKVLAVNKEAKFIDLTNAEPKDNIEIQKWLIKKANIYNIPPIKLGITDEGSLTAREQRDDFRGMIESLVKQEIKTLNLSIIKNKLGWDDVEFTCPLFATKLDYERTRIAVRLRNANIMTINEIREQILGLDRLNDPNADKLIPSKNQD